ncbi:hypothetical protein ACFLZX_04840 [Nanoarchaeota archaeon]
MKLEHIIVTLAATLIPTITHADQQTVIEMETKIRNRNVYEFFQEFPRGIESYKPPFDPDAENLFSEDIPDIYHEIINEVKVNTSFTQEEKSKIIGYSERLISSLKDVEKKEVEYYQRIANSLADNISSPPSYRKVVTNILPKEDLLGLFQSQHESFQLALELFNYVRNTPFYQNELTKGDKETLIEAINPNVSSDKQLIGYIKTQMELVKIRQKYWIQAYK